MSICDNSVDLLRSYGVLLGNESSHNLSLIPDPVFRHWCHFGRVSEVAHAAVGVLLIFICTLSITGNLLVVVIFTRYRRLRSPANTLIVNLAASDMLNGLLHPMAAYSSFQGIWMFGKTGCEVYAALCGLFGLVSIGTLTAIALERWLVISVKPWYGGGILFTNTRAKAAIFAIWLYCGLLVAPPLLGWGAFVPEGFLTSCSFDYLSRTSANRSYFLYIFFLGFFLPILTIGVCYSFIMKTILRNERDMKRNNVKKVVNSSQPRRRRNDYKAAEMIMFVIAMFLISWTPYSLIACVGQFGDRALLTPWVCVLPSLFAKMSTIYNPAIYGLSHRHFRATLRRICKRERGSGGSTYVSRNSSFQRSRNGCPCLPTTYGGSDVLEDSSSASFSNKKVYLGLPVQPHQNHRIVYVKKTQAVRCDVSSGRPAAVLTVKNRHDEDISLIRSLMFRSERDLHQKYQTLMEGGHIVKVPTVVCFKGRHQFPVARLVGEMGWGAAREGGKNGQTTKSNPSVDV